MILKAGTKIAKTTLGMISVQPSGDIILNFDVVGSFFPARDNTSNSYLQIVGQNSIENVVYIDYNDGTGEHSYPFKALGALRRIYFTANANVTTITGLAGTSSFDVSALYFYQDLPVGIKNTVNDTYGSPDSPRRIKLRFEKPQAVTSISLNRVRMFNALSSAIARLSNLETLYINSANYITSFPQDFYNSRIRFLTLTFVGNVLQSGFSNWILNSPMESLQLNETIDLSGDPVVKKFDQIYKLKETLKILNLSTANINYVMPAAVSQLYKLENLTLNNNSSSTLMRFPATLNTLIALKTVSMYSTRMPFTEVERLLTNLPALEVLDIRSCNYASDYDILNINNKLTDISIGAQAWNVGQVPSFINKLTALKILRIWPVSSNPSTIMIGYGNFQNCVNLEQLEIFRCSAMTTDIPTWFSNLIKLKVITAYTSFNTQSRMDTWVNNVYSFVITNASMVAGLTKFRNMTISIYSTSVANDINQSVRPSGTYQQPSGYIVGSSNGTPATPMEKIWVLTAQYGHIWTVKP